LQGELTSNFADVEKQLSGIVGETIVLPVIRVTGGSGNISQSVEVSLNGEIVTLSDNTFVPDKPGTYKVTFYSKDYFKTLEESYTISIAHSDTPIFENLPKLPLALVSEYTYSMGTPNVYMYTVDGKVVKEAKGYWEYKGNRTQFDKELTPVVENSGDIIKLLYTVGDYEYVLGEYAVQIPMLNGQFNPSVFFLTEKGMNSSVDSATTILSSSVSDATATYINPLASEPWSFSFSIDPAKNKGTVKIILSDYSNPTSKVTLKITKNDATKSWLSVNGGNNVSIAGSFESESNRFSLVLNCLTGALTDDNTGTLLAMLTKEVGAWIVDFIKNV
jgi:5-hydroxyisourate hydrolase-like protein (transthyretin family)